MAKTKENLNTYACPELGVTIEAATPEDVKESLSTNP